MGAAARARTREKCRRTDEPLAPASAVPRSRSRPASAVLRSRSSKTTSRTFPKLCTNSRGGSDGSALASGGKGRR
ncbi:unnamed protein product, partial [Nesidiocoris tenuis]